MMSDRFTRRSLLRASAATVAGLGAAGTASATGVDAAELDPERIPLREFDDGELRTETVSPSAVPERAEGVRPGSQLFISFPGGTTAGCTANFVWRDAGGSGGGDLYIGAAGHCFLPEGANASANAQRAAESDDEVFDVSQLSVEICTDCTVGGYAGLVGLGGRTVELGEVVYARQALPDGSQVGHDFGLVRIPDAAGDLVDPSLPQWGGPDGVLSGAAPEGSPVNQYGAGVGNGEVYPTQGSSGVSFGEFGTPESWYAGIRASPGDSGSPLVQTETDVESPGGPAAGILTHITAIGVAGTTMSRCKQMPLEDGVDLDVEVVQP